MSTVVILSGAKRIRKLSGRGQAFHPARESCGRATGSLDFARDDSEELTSVAREEDDSCRRPGS